MRVVLCGLMLWLGSGLTMAADWYVAPDGDDSHAGKLEQPFASIMRAQAAAEPGDTVYLRGGVYRPTEDQLIRRQGLFARIYVLEKSGSQDKPITYRAYRDERPSFDCSAVKPDGKRVTAFYVSGNWLRLIGIDVTGVQVTIKTHTQSICFESQGSHNVFERLSLHDGQAIGVYHVRGAENLFLNCDAWNNWDRTSENGLGVNVDGFGCHPEPTGTGNVFRGCRAWFNSDDGFDCISAHEAVTFENCWAAFNGLSPEGRRLGDGNGFKAGGYGAIPASALPKVIPRHVVRRCVAVGNKSNGFYANHHPGGVDWWHNTAYRNGSNFNLLGRLADNRTDIDGRGHRLINNLSYAGRRHVVQIDSEKCELAGNSFTLGLSLYDDDFASVNEKQALVARLPDGSLPPVDFLHPVATSSLIDAGVESSSPFAGLRPDIGAFEVEK